MSSSSSSSEAPIILYVGLDPHAMPVASMPIGKQVIEELGKAEAYANQQGFDYEFFAHGPEDGEKHFLDKITSKPYDAVIAGGGLKVLPDANLTFEQVINAIKDLQPKARIIFTAGADQILDSVKRAGQSKRRQEAP